MLFRENRGVYGYRCLHQALKQERIILSGKVVRQIMKDENLVVLGMKQKKYDDFG
ncbi:IS3 family transposase [Agathobaculum desmolans]|uniref:IS3 family transposase n=1 Tax=Agathobaculum desmolans TaxID=39484 RepID=UPI0013781788